MLGQINKIAYPQRIMIQDMNGLSNQECGCDRPYGEHRPSELAILTQEWKDTISERLSRTRT